VNLSGLFVRRPIGTILLAIGILLLGVAAYLRLPVAPLPQLDLPFIFVSASEPGANPQVMAATVAAPLEHRLGSIPGVTEMTSTSSSGNSTIVMQFDLSRDVNGAARDVQAAINAAAPDLPSGMPSPPTYHKANPADQPVIILALTSHSLPVSELYSLGDSLVGQDIRQLSGVAEVDVAGGADPSIRVAVNPAALASMGLSIDDVRNALAQSTDNAPKGLISGPDHQYMISADDQLLTAAQFRKVIIGQKNGRPIRLTDVATVSKGQENDQQAAWLNGQRAVLIMVRKQADANVIKTANAVKTLLPRLQHWLPPAAHIQVVADRTQTIRASVNEVQIALLASLTWWCW
jgi:Cation/multidrug efflux pump